MEFSVAASNAVCSCVEGYSGDRCEIKKQVRGKNNLSHN